MRSLSISEEAYFPYSTKALLYFGEEKGIIHCGRSLANDPHYFPQTFGWWSNLALPQSDVGSIEPDFRWIWSCGGFGIGVLKVLPAQLDDNVKVTLPYWSIVIPLTLLSAWLLLSKPRRHGLPASEPAPTNGTDHG